VDRSEQRPVLVVGVGGSAASLAALAWAASEARRRDAKLRVVQAWQPRPARASYAGTGRAVSGGTGNELAMEALAADHLAAHVRSVLGVRSDIDVVTELIEGSPERVLAEASADAELLVLGSGNYAPVAHADPLIVDKPIGPVIRSCLSHARCPVLIISAGAAAQRSPLAAELVYRTS
jgi:nucleotide-binding universal stress UspA family protein